MSASLGWVTIGCIIAAGFCGLASTLVWYEIIAQIQDSGSQLKFSWWGRPSWGEIGLVFRTHCQHFPSSSLRKIWIALIVLPLALMFIAIGIVLTHPGPPSR